MKTIILFIALTTAAVAARAADVVLSWKSTNPKGAAYTISVGRARAAWVPERVIKSTNLSVRLDLPPGNHLAVIGNLTTSGVPAFVEFDVPVTKVIRKNNRRDIFDLSITNAP